MTNGILRLESPSGSGFKQIIRWKNLLLTPSFKGVYSWNGQKWKRISAKPKGQIITVTNKDEIFVGGVNGIIYHSVSGETWQKLKLPIEENVCSIKKTSLGTLLVGTEYGKIYRSVDNGKTFVQSETPASAWYIVKRIIEDGNTLISINHAQKTAIISDNDGITWQELHYFSNNAEILPELYRKHRTNSSIELIDGGLITFNSRNFIPEALDIEDACVIDDTLYAIKDLSGVYYTKDLENWKKLPLKISRKFYFITLCVTPKGEIMIGGGHSNDGCVLVDPQQWIESAKKKPQKKNSKMSTKGLDEKEKKRVKAIQYFRNEDINPNILSDIERFVVVSSRIKTLKKKPLRFESKYGGTPDFLFHIEWPVHQGVPMFFVGQVNLEELQTSASQKKLPAKGVLYFFADTKYFDDGGETDICPVKVIYQKEALNHEKVDTKLPPSVKVVDLEKIKFQYQISLPANRQSVELQLLEQKMELLKLSVIEQFDLFYSHPVVENEDYETDSRGIMAYPICMQSDPKGCKMNADIDSLEAFKEKIKIARDQNLLFEWENLDGDLSFFITSSDLENLNFDKAWGIYMGT